MVIKFVGKLRSFHGLNPHQHNIVNAYGENLQDSPTTLLRLCGPPKCLSLLTNVNMLVSNVVWLLHESLKNYNEEVSII